VVSRAASVERRPVEEEEAVVPRDLLAADREMEAPRPRRSPLERELIDDDLVVVERAVRLESGAALVREPEGERRLVAGRQDEARARSIADPVPVVVVRIEPVDVPEDLLADPDVEARDDRESGRLLGAGRSAGARDRREG